MLKTRFPRPVGDVGNAASFQFSTLYETVEAATVAPVTAVGGPSDALLDPFTSRLNTLIDRGATMLGTSCGFLSPFQHALSVRLNRPFLSSSLLALPHLQDQFGGEGRIGVLTYRAENLGAAHFPPGCRQLPPIAGLPREGHLATVIRDDQHYLSQESAEKEVVAASMALRDDAPELRAILFECTNLGPYSDAVVRATGLPVFDVVWALQALAAGEFAL